MSMKPSDRLIASIRGTAAQAIAYAASNGAARLVEVTAYVQEVYRLGPLVGLDPSIVIAQSVHETSIGPRPWASTWWVQRLNPAGIGITGDPEQNAASHTWATGTEAAQAQLSHLLVYALGPADAGSKWFRVTGESIKNVDVRYDDYLAAYGNTAQAETIADLGGTWATDTKYGPKVAARGNAVYPDLPDQEGIPPVPSDMPTIPVHWLPVPVGASNNPSGLLLPGSLIVVWHENGNPSSDADDEARFLLNGGGESRVSYHFAVDHEKAYQMFALNEICYHAADGCNDPRTDRGCFRGVAIEHCQDRDPGRWAATKRNGAILTAMICAGHPSIHFGGREGDFSPDRIETHQAVSETNKHCPDWMLNEHVIDDQIARVKALLSGSTPTTTTTEPPGPPPVVARTPLPLPADTKDGAVLFFANRAYQVVGPRRLRLLRDAVQYAAPDGVSLASHESLPKGKAVSVPYVTDGTDGVLYRASVAGTYIKVTNFAERRTS